MPFQDLLLESLHHGDEMRLIAFFSKAESIRCTLTHIGELAQAGSAKSSGRTAQQDRG